MWLALLAKVLQEIVPKIVEQIIKGNSNKRGFMAEDNSSAVNEIRSGLSEALAMMEKGE